MEQSSEDNLQYLFIFLILQKDVRFFFKASHVLAIKNVMFSSLGNLKSFILVYLISYYRIFILRSHCFIWVSDTCSVSLFRLVASPVCSGILYILSWLTWHLVAIKVFLIGVISVALTRLQICLSSQQSSWVCLCCSFLVSCACFLSPVTCLRAIF